MAYGKTLKSVGQTVADEPYELGIDFTGWGGGQPSTAGSKSQTRAMRKAKYITTPGAGDLPETTGMDFKFPGRVDYRTEWAQGKHNVDIGGDYGADVGKFTGATSEFEKEFMIPMEEIYYEDYLGAARDYYFDLVSPKTLLQETDPTLDVSGLQTLEKELPATILGRYKTGADSPYLNLRDVKEGAGIELEEAVEGIEEEEEVVQRVKDLYSDVEEADIKQKEALTAKGILAEQGVEGMISKSGYERGPGEKQLELIKKAGTVEKGELYKTKRRAQIQRKTDIDAAEDRMKKHFAAADRAFTGIGRAENIYKGRIGGGPGSDFYDLAFDTLSAAQTGMETVQASIEDMFNTALDNAKAASNKPYKGGVFPFLESRFKGERDLYSGVLESVETNIKNLGSFLPQAGDIAQETIDPFERGGEFDWLVEGYQDTVTYD